MPVFSRLVPSITCAYAAQTLCALLFVPQQNEKYFDLSGAIGWLSTTFISLYYPALKARYLDGIPVALPLLSSFSPRQRLLTAMVGIWSLRLGSFLTIRAIKAGGDSRFDIIKKNPRRFACYWIAQATWIILAGLPVWLVNTLPTTGDKPLTTRDYAALGLYAFSLLFESLADYQKSAWRKAKDKQLHNESFITSGLWSISRHPNYVGEVGIWTGIYALSTAALQTSNFPSGTAAVAAISPLFTYFLVKKVSGVPSLERIGDTKFGNNAKWHEYKKNVPVFWPRLW